MFYIIDSVRNNLGILFIFFLFFPHVFNLLFSKNYGYSGL